MTNEQNEINTVSEQETFRVEEMEMDTKAFTKWEMGVAIGATFTGAGAAGAVTGIFVERKKRKKLLKTLELSVAYTKASLEGNTTYGEGKDLVDLSKMNLRNKLALMSEINDRVSKVKMNKKEREQWITVIEALMNTSIAVNENEKLETGQIVKEELGKQENKDKK